MGGACTISHLAVAKVEHALYKPTPRNSTLVVLDVLGVNRLHCLIDLIELVMF